MAVIDVKCPMCKETNVIKFSTNTTDKQRYKCKNEYCAKDTFLLEYSRNGDLPEIKQKIIDMALNGRGVRDTAKVLCVSMNTVISELKKENSIVTVNQTLLTQRQLDQTSMQVDIVKVEEVELDEMWSLVGKKIKPTLVMACD